MNQEHDYMKLNNKFNMKINEYFRQRPHLGRVKTVSLMEPWGHGRRYRVKCTLQREYIVYEQGEQIKNIGTYHDMTDI